MHTVLGFGAILMWGLLAVFSLFTKSVPPFQLLFLCFSIAFLLVFFKRLFKAEPCFAKPNLSPLQWLVGTLALFGFHLCYFLAIRYAPAMEVSLISYLWPLLLGIYLSTRGFRIFSIIGGAIGFLGSAILLTSDAQIKVESSHMTGYMLAFLCALIWSGYSWFLSRTHSNVEDIGWISLLVALLSLVAHLCFETTQWNMSMLTILNVLLLGLGPVGGAFYLWDIGMKHGNRQLLASMSFSTPVISSLALYLFGFSDLSTSVVLAVLMILIGALVTNSAPRLKRMISGKGYAPV